MNIVALCRWMAYGFTLLLFVAFYVIGMSAAA